MGYQEAVFQESGKRFSTAQNSMIPDRRFLIPERGAIAQLGERLNGIQEVGGSTPPGSTIN
jgi:hypothetical protein